MTGGMFQQLAKRSVVVAEVGKIKRQTVKPISRRRSVFVVMSLGTKKLQELENGEFRAGTLAEVVSKDEVDPDVLVPIFDAKGTLSVKKGSTTVPMPTGPEQLRRRLNVMQNCLMMLAIKHVHHEELKDIGKEVFEKYKDYLLGDYVWGLSSTDLQGNRANTAMEIGALLWASYQEEGLQHHAMGAIATGGCVGEGVEMSGHKGETCFYTSGFVFEEIFSKPGWGLGPERKREKGQGQRKEQRPWPKRREDLLSVQSGKVLI